MPSSPASADHPPANTTRRTKDTFFGNTSTNSALKRFSLPTQRGSLFGGGVEPLPCGPRFLLLSVGP